MASFTAPGVVIVRRRGPAMAWPRRRPAADPATAFDGDTVIRLVAATAVLGVAAIAAIVSYSHIFDLARHHAEAGTAARLLPVSVDGLIASASLALLHAARKRIRAPWMAYLMLWLGVGATIAANVAYGLPAGWLSAVIAAWPATAFVGSVEMALMLARNERREPPDGGREIRHRWQEWRSRKTAIVVPDDGQEPAIDDAPAAAASEPPQPPSESVISPPRQRPKAVRKAATPSAAKAAKVDALLTADAGLTNAEIARRTGASESTVRRRREDARKTREHANGQVLSASS